MRTVIILAVLVVATIVMGSEPYHDYYGVDVGRKLFQNENLNSLFWESYNEILNSQVSIDWDSVGCRLGYDPTLKHYNGAIRYPGDGLGNKSTWVPKKIQFGDLEIRVSKHRVLCSDGRVDSTMIAGFSNADGVTIRLYIQGEKVLMQEIWVDGYSNLPALLRLTDVLSEEVSFHILRYAQIYKK